MHDKLWKCKCSFTTHNEDVFIEHNAICDAAKVPEENAACIAVKSFMSMFIEDGEFQGIIIGGGIIVLTSAILLALTTSKMRDTELPDREKYPNLYETVHVDRWEKTTCFGCHN